jgi:tetratricopeptide (TPR) repeat protein
MISLCMIVRDEERVLARCLASVTGLVSEIIVVDTGSQDRTVAIAQDYGAEIRHFTWIDDFAAARNASLIGARGDWILVLDADESLTPQFRATLPQILEVYQGDLIGCIIENHFEDHSEYSGLVGRVFRNLPGVHFERPYHEYLVGISGEAVAFEELVIAHDGYQEHIVIQKDKPNLGIRIMQQYVDQHPQDIYLRVKLAGAYDQAGLWDAAYRECQQTFIILTQEPTVEPTTAYELYLTWGLLHAQRQQWPIARAAVEQACHMPLEESFKNRAYQHLVQLYLEQKDYGAIVNLTTDLLTLFPKVSMFYRVRAIALWLGEGNTSGAEGVLEKGFSIVPTSLELWQTLTYMYIEMGNMALAEQTLKRALNYLPHAADLQTSLTQIQLMHLANTFIPMGNPLPA